MKNRSLFVSLLIAGALVFVGVASSISVNRRTSTTGSNMHASASTLPNTPASPRTLQEAEQRFQRRLGGATEQRSATTQEAIDLSKWIVLVRAKSTEVRELADKNIFTFSEFEVLESVKGKFPDRTLTLRILGGKLGDVEVTKPFDMDFVPARKYILFLGEKNTFGYPTISPQDIYTVLTDAHADSEFISPVPNDLPLYEAKSRKRYENRSQRLPLDDFLYSVRKAATK